MRLATLKNKASDGKTKPEYAKLFKLAETLTENLVRILVAATESNELVWQYDGLNVFSCEFKGVNFSWDQPNNEPAHLFIEGTSIQDNGSGDYGFTELSHAIFSKHSHQKLMRKGGGLERSHPYRHPNRSD